MERREREIERGREGKEGRGDGTRLQVVEKTIIYL